MAATSNTLLTIDMITREALRILVNELSFTKKINREYNDYFAKTGAKIGDTLRLRKPPRYVTTAGAALTKQSSDEGSVSISLAQHHVGMAFTTYDLSLKIDDFSKRFIKPAVAALANLIDFTATLEYRDVWNISGTIGGGVPNTLSAYITASKLLTQAGTPDDGLRSIVINSEMMGDIVDSLRGLFHSEPEIKRQYEKGRMGHAIGFDWVLDENIRLHTNGSRSGSPLVNDTVAEGDTTIDIDTLGGASDTVKRGDVFTIASVNSVNPQSRQNNGRSANFVATGDKTGSGNAITGLGVGYAMRSTGKDQTLTALPADNAAVTFNGAANATGFQGLAFHRDAFVLAMADLELPQGLHFAGRVSSPELGVSLRVIRDYDISEDEIPARVDVVFGAKAVRPEMACRITT